MINFLLIITVLLLTSCASNVSTGDPEQDYERIKESIKSGHYNESIDVLEKFPSKHPYSQYSVQAELLHIYTAYKLEQYILSETLAGEFIKRHPRHPDVAYAKYLLGMSHYRQLAPAKKDQGETRKAIKAFNALISSHPKTKYARDAKKRMGRLYRLLAMHELEIGKYYFDLGRYVAAINRFDTIVRDYQTSKAIEEALYYMAASYSALDLKDDARITALLLRHNYPRSKWSSKSRRYL